MTEQRIDWIAARTLTDEKTGRKVVVSLGPPEKISVDEWRCRFHIEGVEPDQTRYAHGLDSFQALLIAFEGIYSLLASSNIQLTWYGGKSGDTGFPRFVPQAFGLDFSRQINHVIDEEIERFAKMARERWDSKRGLQEDT